MSEKLNDEQLAALDLLIAEKRRDPSAFKIKVKVKNAVRDINNLAKNAKDLTEVTVVVAAVAAGRVGPDGQPIPLPETEIEEEISLDQLIEARRRGVAGE